VPAGFEEGLMELVANGLPPRGITVYLAPSGTVLVPLEAVLEFTGTPVQRPDSARLLVRGARGVGFTTLNVAALTITGDRTVTLGPEEVVRVGGALYLAAPRVAELLGGTAEVDLGALHVVLARDPPFPAQERSALARARRRQGLPGARAAPAVDVPFRPRSGGGVLEWGVSANLPGSVPTTLSLRAGASVWGGLLQAGTLLLDPADGGAVELTASFQRVFPTSRLLRQVQVGDVVAEGVRARSVRGLVLTNAPFARDAEFSELQYSPHLPEGWEYELYQGGQLLGFSAAGGAPVPLTLQYGSTPVQVRLYGPAGERVVSDVVYLVPTLQLPAGRAQYTVSGGVCPRSERCDALGVLDLRYGAGDRLTVLAGAEGESDTLGSRVRPYAGVSAIPAPGWVLEAQAMAGSYARASLLSAGGGSVSGSASAGVQWPAERGRSVLGGGGFSGLPDTVARWHTEGLVRVRRSTARNFGFVNLTARAEGSAGSGVGLLRGSLSTAARGVLLEGIFQRDAPRADTLPPNHLVLGRATAGLPWLRTRRLGLPVLSLGAGTGAQGLQQWEARVSLHPGSGSLDVTTRWVRGAGTPSVLLGSSVRLGAARARARAGSVAGRTEGAFSVDGGVALGGGRPLPLEFGGVGLTGAAGAVFHDLDGDGRLGAGDEPVTDAWVGVGGIRVRTDARGRYATWSVLPYGPLTVALDTAALTDPAWVPARADTLFRPSPHLFTRVDFPLVRTREVAGALVSGAGVAPAAGVTVEILRGATGEVVERALTFTDGEFYFGRVLPGEYRLRVAESSLRALGAAAVADVPFTVAGTGDQILVEIPPVRLNRAR
jgi:hypothetical protein